MGKVQDVEMVSTTVNFFLVGANQFVVRLDDNELLCEACRWLGKELVVNY